MNRGSLGPRFLRLHVIVSGLAGIAVSLALLSGIIDARNLSQEHFLALFFAILIVLITPFNLRCLRAIRSCPKDAIRPYLLMVMTIYVSASVASIFGSSREIEMRFLAHILGAEIVHRLLLLFPGHSVAQLQRLGKTRLYSLARLALVNLVILLVLSEGMLRGLTLVSNQLDFLIPKQGYSDRKLSRPFFGQPPNTFGFNDREFTAEKAPEAFRIAVIGDSFIVGLVPRRYGFVSSLEEHLRRVSKSVDLLNFGVVGSEPKDYVEVLQEEVLAFKPDLVLLGFYVGNDVKVPRSNLSPFYKDWYITFRLFDWLREERRTDRRFYDLSLLEDQSPELWRTWSRIPQVWDREEFLRQSARRESLLRLDSQTELSHAWPRTLALLREFHEICAAAETPASIVIFPDQVQVDKNLRGELAQTHGWDLSALNHSLPQERLTGFLREATISHIDLLPFFVSQDVKPPARLYLPNDTHLAPLGNRLAAQAVADWLVKSGQVDSL